MLAYMTELNRILNKQENNYLKLKNLTNFIYYCKLIKNITIILTEG